MAQQHTSSGTRPVCSRGVPYSYHILPYVVQGLTVEGISGAGLGLSGCNAVTHAVAVSALVGMAVSW